MLGRTPTAVSQDTHVLVESGLLQSWDEAGLVPSSHGLLTLGRVTLAPLANIDPLR